MCSCCSGFGRQAHTRFCLGKCCFRPWPWESNCCLFTLSLSLPSAMIHQWLAPVKKLGVRGPGGPQICPWRLKLLMYHESSLFLVQVEQPRPFPVPRPHIPPYDPLQAAPLYSYRFCVEAQVLVICPWTHGDHLTPDPFPLMISAQLSGSHLDFLPGSLTSFLTSPLNLSLTSSYSIFDLC